MILVDVDDASRAACDGFAPADRAIFRYGLGPARPDYRADPLAIEGRFEDLIAGQNPEAIDKWLKREVLSVRLMAWRRLLPTINAAFGLPAFAEDRPEGLTAGESMALLGRFFAYQDRLRARYRREAELLVTYGALPGRVHTFEREVGLWLNRGRAQAFAGVAHWRGAVAASGAAKAHRDLTDAMAATEAGAADLEAQIEGNRQEAIARASRPANH